MMNLKAFEEGTKDKYSLRLINRRFNDYGLEKPSMILCIVDNNGEPIHNGGILYILDGCLHSCCDIDSDVAKSTGLKIDEIGCLQYDGELEIEREEAKRLLETRNNEYCFMELETSRC